MARQKFRATDNRADMATTFKSGETTAMQEALQALFEADPDLREARAVAGALPDRRREPGFEILMLLIIEQQVSIASARAIWARVKAGIPQISPEAVLALSDEDLRGFGLSRPKVRYCRALAQSVSEGSLSLQDLPELPDQEAMAALTTVTGIGRWTAALKSICCFRWVGATSSRLVMLPCRQRLWTSRNCPIGRQRRTCMRLQSSGGHTVVSLHSSFGVTMA